jgi:hypothetical protein
MARYVAGAQAVDGTLSGRGAGGRRTRDGMTRRPGGKRQ